MTIVSPPHPGIVMQPNSTDTEAAPPDMELVDSLRRALAAHCLIRGGLFDETQMRVAVDAAVERMTVRRLASAPSQLARG